MPIFVYLRFHFPSCVCVGGSKEHEVLIDNVDNLCSTLVDIDELMPKFVTKRMITMEMAAIIRKAGTPREKVQKLLEYITGPVEAGKVKVFYNLLDIMEEHGLEATQELAEEMRNQLNVKVNFTQLYCILIIIDGRYVRV